MRVDVQVLRFGGALTEARSFEGTEQEIEEFLRRTADLYGVVNVLDARGNVTRTVQPGEEGQAR